LLCEDVDLRANERVLDVGTGTGNTAIAAARRWCTVTGIDFVPALLERARERAKVERCEIELLEGDAEAIPFAEGSFDVVLSTFGVMFALDQKRAASEMLRVCRPGGRIGMTNFPPDSLAAMFARANSRVAPPPRGVQSPMTWGTDRGLKWLFGDEADLSITRRSVRMRAPDPAAAVAFFRTNFGPVREAFAALDDESQKELAGLLTDLVAKVNVSGDDTVVAPWDYVEVVVKRP
jgi:ubiquinone/menaquinone biosynthesis C-methylase UbiE